MFSPRSSRFFMASIPVVPGYLLSKLYKSTSCEVNEADKKKNVGYRSVDKFVKDGMTIGLGTGSTTYFAAERLGQLLREKKLKDVKVVPCSEFLKDKCIAWEIPITTLALNPRLDIAIDGADEVDLNLSFIKGGSGAFLREKIVQKVADHVFIVVDDSKLTRKLGLGHPVPVEVTPFSSEHIKLVLETLLPSLKGCRALLRMGNVNNTSGDGFMPAVTDNGNYIIDLYFEKPINVYEAIKELDSTSGVIEHGLLAADGHTTVIIASDRGMRLAGEAGEAPWWEDKQLKKNPTARLSIDNRTPDEKDLKSTEK